MQTEANRIRSIIEEKVIGKIQAAHDEFGHHYKLPSGKVVDSVTTKLIIEKPHLIKWAIKLGFEWMERDGRWAKLTKENREEYLQGMMLAHTEVRDDAGNVGHIAHEVIENYLNDWIKNGNPTPDIRTLIKEGTNYRVYGVARSCEASFKKYQVIPIASEILVGSEKYACAGTLDALMLNVSFPEFPEIELWDWKSSNQVNDQYALQVAAYKKFFEDMTGLKITRCRILHLDKFSDKYKCYNVPNLPQALKAFKGIAAAYDWVKNGKKKLIEDKIIVSL